MGANGTEAAGLVLFGAGLTALLVGMLVYAADSDDAQGFFYLGVSVSCGALSCAALFMSLVFRRKP